MSLAVEVILRITHTDGEPVCESVTRRILPHMRIAAGDDRAVMMTEEVTGAYGGLEADVHDGMDRMRDQVAQLNRDIRAGEA